MPTWFLLFWILIPLNSMHILLSEEANVSTDPCDGSPKLIEGDAVDIFFPEQPYFGIQQYPNNSDCVWKLQVQSSHFTYVQPCGSFDPQCVHIFVFRILEEHDALLYK